MPFRLLLVAPLVAAGFGMAFTMPAATAAVMGAAPDDRGGLASGVINTARQVGGVIGGPGVAPGNAVRVRGGSDYPYPINPSGFKPGRNCQVRSRRAANSGRVVAANPLTPRCHQSATEPSSFHQPGRSVGRYG